MFGIIDCISVSSVKKPKYVLFCALAFVWCFINYESLMKRFRSVLLFCYSKSKNTAKKIFDLYGEDCRTSVTCEKQVAKFRFGSFYAEDVPRSGRTVKFNEGKIKSLIYANRQIRLHKIFKRLNLRNSTVIDNVKRLELISNLDIWVSHDLTGNNLLRRLDICDLFLKRQER